MKTKYNSPVIIVEDFEKTDVLLNSEPLGNIEENARRSAKSLFNVNMEDFL